MNYRFLLLSVLCGVLFFGCEPPANQAPTGQETAELNLYTHRHYPSDQQLIALFTEKTGIKVNVVNASADELLLKMENEGEQSPADVLLTVDAGRLERANSKNLLQPIVSDVIDANVPAHLREKENRWVGLTKRARIMVYDKERTTPDVFSTYEALTDPAWTGKVLVRSSGNIYNQSLMASIIANNGEAEAKAWAAGMVVNMARAPKGNDRDQMKAVVAGEGDVAIVNTYYLGHLINSDDPAEVAVGKRIGVFFPNQDGRGAHINVSGAGVAKYAPNKANAIKFIEFLSSVEAQHIFSSANFEYPVNPKAEAAPLLAEWGSFKEDQLSLSQLGALNKQAVLTFDEAGWK